MVSLTGDRHALVLHGLREPPFIVRGEVHESDTTPRDTQRAARRAASVVSGCVR